VFQLRSQLAQRGLVDAMAGEEGPDEFADRGDVRRSSLSPKRMAAARATASSAFPFA
jgi:hypothetical protein